MANPIMGELAFEVAGQRYVFRMGTYARAILQKRNGLTFTQFFQRGDQAGDAGLIDVFHAGLFQKHQLNDEQIGEMLDELGPERAWKIVADAISLAMPKSAEVAGKPNGNPTAAGQAVGIGTGLSPNG